MLVVAACGDAAESVTWTPKILCPADVGVPVMLPEVESARPKGSCPEITFHLYGATPPFAVRPALYEFPSAPLGNEEVLMLSGVDVPEVIVKIVTFELT